jgi:hypothetical protein
MAYEVGNDKKILKFRGVAGRCGCCSCKIAKLGAKYFELAQKGITNAAEIGVDPNSWHIAPKLIQI